jgi:hypothetical protein
MHRKKYERNRINDRVPRHSCQRIVANIAERWDEAADQFALCPRRLRISRGVFYRRRRDRLARVAIGRSSKSLWKWRVAAKARINNTRLAKDGLTVTPGPRARSHPAAPSLTRHSVVCSIVGELSIAHGSPGSTRFDPQANRNPFAR